MTSKNGADFVHFVMPAQAPASQNGQSRADIAAQNGVSAKLAIITAANLSAFAWEWFLP